VLKPIFDDHKPQMSHKGETICHRPGLIVTIAIEYFEKTSASQKNTDGKIKSCWFWTLLSSTTSLFTLVLFEVLLWCTHRSLCALILFLLKISSFQYFDHWETRITGLWGTLEYFCGSCFVRFFPFATDLSDFAK
jgi:hypothetical protein